MTVNIQNTRVNDIIIFAKGLYKNDMLSDCVRLPNFKNSCESGGALTLYVLGLAGVLFDSGGVGVCNTALSPLW